MRETSDQNETPSLMYKTAVYMLVNSSFTHQKQQISEKRWHYAAWHGL